MTETKFIGNGNRNGQTDWLNKNGIQNRNGIGNRNKKGNIIQFIMNEVKQNLQLANLNIIIVDHLRNYRLIG